MNKQLIYKIFKDAIEDVQEIKRYTYKRTIKKDNQN